MSTTKWTELPTPPGFNVIKEGTASVLVPDGNQVFYNEVQEFNRDLSILVISQFATNTMEERSTKAQQWIDKMEAKKAAEASKLTSDTTTTTSPSNANNDQSSEPLLKKKQTTSPTLDSTATSTDPGQQFVSLNPAVKACQSSTILPRLQYNGVRIFEALSASGLRSIRYFNEIPYVDTIHVNDMDTEAVESIRRNVVYNQLPLEKVIPNRNEATAALYANRATTHDLVTKLKVHQQSTLPQQPQEIDDNHPLAFLYKHQHADTASLAPDFVPGLPLWNVIDLDPYGSAAPFLDAALQAIEDDGLLCVTCTDGAVLCGNYMETGFAKYNAIPLHTTDISKEFGLRMLLHTIESTATKYGRTITPLLSLSIDFYVRVFFKVTTSAAQVKFSGSRRVFVGHCVSCRTTVTARGMTSTPEFNPNLPISQQTKSKHSHSLSTLPRHCELCHHRLKVCGPIWGDAIQDPHFIKQCLQTLEHRQYRATQTNPEKVEEDVVIKQDSNNDGTSKPTTTVKPPHLLELTPIPRITSKFGTFQRLKGMLTMACSELPHGLPISLPSIAQALCISTPRLEVLQSAFLNAGYQVSETHTAPNNIKTNAPHGFYMDVLRAYLVMENGSLTKPWPNCSKSPRKWVGGNFVKDHNGEPITYTNEEDTQVQEWKETEIGKDLIDWHSQVDVILKDTPYEALPSHQQPTQSILAIRNKWTTQFDDAKKPPSQNQVMSSWLMSQPIKSEVNFKSQKRVKIPLFFENPNAFWGPKAAAGSFDTRGYTNLTAQGAQGADAETQTKNISRALALAQQQRALDNQHKFKEKRLAKKEASNQNNVVAMKDEDAAQ